MSRGCAIRESRSGTSGPMSAASSDRSMASSGVHGWRPTGAPSIRSAWRSSSCVAIPDSRRILVSAWNVGELEQMHLMPCHALFQFYVANGRLSCQLYQRSADIFLGVPFNIASYTHCSPTCSPSSATSSPGEFIWTGGDCHLYRNHLEQAKLQLSRAPFPSPRLNLRRRPATCSTTPQGFRVRGLPAPSRHCRSRGGLI